VNYVKISWIYVTNIGFRSFTFAYDKNTHLKINQMKQIGIVIMILGLGLTLFTAITFFTREKVVDLGIVEITRNQPHYLNWSPFVGMAVMVIGGFMIYLAKKR